VISAARRRALDVLNSRNPMETVIFALYMWPMSPSWRNRRSGQSRQSHPNAPVGRGICLKAGAFLSLLVKDGLSELRHDDAGQPLGYVLTPEGVRVALTTTVGVGE
jgi:hypothetical protein